MAQTYLSDSLFVQTRKNWISKTLEIFSKSTQSDSTRIPVTRSFLTPLNPSQFNKSPASQPHIKSSMKDTSTPTSTIKTQSLVSLATKQRSACYLEPMMSRYDFSAADILSVLNQSQPRLVLMTSRYSMFWKTFVRYLMIQLSCLK